MYTARIRSIVTYAALIWWEGMNKDKNRKILTKVQRLAALGTTGTKKNTALAALATTLEHQPIEWYMKGLAAERALRLRESNLWKTSNYGHSRILAE